MYNHAMAAGKREALAASLHVSVEALDMLRVGIGWDAAGRREEFASFPSRNAMGKVIGITRRYANGKKLTYKGTSNAGVFLAPEWWKRPGPVWIVEGPSDTATLLSEGLAVIGRPSNTGGVEIIRRLLARHRPRDGVIVVGEHDAKPERRGTQSQCPADCDGCSWCYPGRFGAREVARQLRARWIMPPDGIKDVRDWRTKRGDDFVAELFGRVGGMNSAELIESIQAVKLELAAMREDREAHKAEHDRLRQDIDGLAAAVETLNAKVDKVIDRIRTRLDEIKDALSPNGKPPNHGARKAAAQPMKACPVPECKRQFRGDKIMCGHHWLRVPDDLRRRVWDDRQKYGENSREHRVAIEAAIASVTPSSSAAS